MIFPEVPFYSSSGPSLGVEWEFALVDRTTRDLVNTGGQVVERIHEQYPELKKHVHKEFLRNTVELVTGITYNTAEAISQLRNIHNIVKTVLDPLNLDLFGAGTHPFGKYTEAILTSDSRYEEMLERTQWWGRQMLIWGIHVHVGITDCNRVMPILSSLLSFYPHLLALSASSPIWDSMSTGYASNRAMLFQQLPTAGLPFQFTLWKQFEEFVYDQRVSGIIDNLNEIRWDIRPSTNYGTLEVRISDSVSSFEDLAAIVALTHCLVVWLDRQIARGKDIDYLKPWQVQENKWRAARYGLDAIITTHSDNSYAHIVQHLSGIMEQLTPIAQELDCYYELTLVENILSCGASYQRQLAQLTHSGGDYVSVVDSVVSELRN